MAALAFGHRFGQQGPLAARFDLRHHLQRQGLQGLDLHAGQLPRDPIEHRHCAQRVAVRCHQRHAGIETQMRLAADEPVAAATRIGLHVLDDVQPALLDGV